MDHAAPGQKSRLKYYKILSLALSHLSFLFVIYFSVSDSNVANYANDNTPYSAKKELMNALNDLEKEFDIILK